MFDPAVRPVILNIADIATEALEVQNVVLEPLSLFGAIVDAPETSTPRKAVLPAPTVFVAKQLTVTMAEVPVTTVTDGPAVAKSVNDELVVV